jgi:hypothetical protein
MLEQRPCDNMNEYQVPLVERLKSVPNDARFVQQEEFSSAYYPVGTLCHQAADRIAELEKENDFIKNNLCTPLLGPMIHGHTYEDGKALPTKTLTDSFIYENHMGYVSPSGAFYAPDYPTWKQDGFTPVYREPVVAKTLTDAEFDNIFANGKRLGVLETEDRFRKAMNLTDEEIKETLKIYYPRNADNHINDLVWFARALLRKAQE